MIALADYLIKVLDPIRLGKRSETGIESVSDVLLQTLPVGMLM